jgi:hypothetical protein
VFPKTKPKQKKKEVALYAQNVHGILSSIVKVRLGGSYLYKAVMRTLRKEAAIGITC